MAAALCVNALDRLLQQQLPQEMQEAGLVVRNTFIDFQKPLITGSRERAQSEGAKPIVRALKDEANCHTPDLWGDEGQPMQIPTPVHFTVNDFVASLNYSDGALIDYWLAQGTPDLAVCDRPVFNTFADFQGPGATTSLGGGCRTPSLWGDEEQLMKIAESMDFLDSNVGYSASFMRAFDQSDFTVNDSLAQESSAGDSEVRQITCDGACTGCYWHTKNNSCHWADKCKFCHRCRWRRLT